MTDEDPPSIYYSQLNTSSVRSVMKTLRSLVEEINVEFDKLDEYIEDQEHGKEKRRGTH